MRQRIGNDGTFVRDFIDGFEIASRYVRLVDDAYSLLAAADELERQFPAELFALGVARAYRVRAAEILDREDEER